MSSNPISGEVADYWRYKDGQSRLNAYLDDYAFLIDGILELRECRLRAGDLEFALSLADVLLKLGRFTGQLVIEKRRNVLCAGPGQCWGWAICPPPATPC